jgi:putative Mg2+ transporter-C (MgtC) family protein
MEFEILGEVALAMLFGGIVGAEREFAHKPAGFRTHMLVAGAAALLVGLAGILVDRFAQRAGSAVSGDPIRVVQAIVLGISFLGAGTIFRREGGGVEGLTTGAALLFSGAIGIAVALDQFFLAGSCAILVFIVLRAVGWLEDRLRERSSADRGRRGQPPSGF